MITLYLLILLVVIVLFFLGGFIWWGMKKAIWLSLNSVVGFFALYAVQQAMFTLVINFWSVIIVALFGLFGLIVVVALHLLGVAF